MVRGTPRHDLVDYPESDGQPVAESDTHFEEMADYVIAVLKDHFREQPNVYVAGNNFIYYVEGQPKFCVSPDAYVVHGVKKRRRRIYQVWKENGRVPSIVFEITSKKTHRTDKKKKLDIYEKLGVSEVVLFDPLGEWIPERLRTYRLESAKYVLVLGSNQEPGARFESRALGLSLGIEDDHLRFYLPTGERLRTRFDWVEEAHSVGSRAESAETRAESAETRAKDAEARAERAEARMDDAEAQAELERTRADELAAELAALKEKLDRS